MEPMQRSSMPDRRDDPAAEYTVMASARSPHRGRTVMRQMLIAAAIAAGLVALWVALLPIAA